MGEEPLVEHVHLRRSGLAMAAGTLTSRVLGFVRTAVWAGALGLNIVGSAYLVANTVPDVIYALLAGGMLTAIFVPQLVSAARSGDGEAQAQRLITLACALLAAMTLLAVIAAPAIARLCSGANWAARDVALTTAFAVWCLPQIFYGLYAVLSQVLTTRGAFAPMMWAPALNNVIAISVGGRLVACVLPGCSAAAVTTHWLTGVFGRDLGGSMIAVVFGSGILVLSCVAMARALRVPELARLFRALRA